jgi:tRNA A-37 threonylcarbamoyl transferase component Bud32
MSPPLLRDDRHGFRVWRQDTAAAAAALELLFPDPDEVLARGDVRKPGSRAHGAVVDVAGKHYFLKRYNCRGTFYRLQYVLRRSRAVHTWQLAWAFLERGVPVPMPLVCLEERCCRLLGRSYVLMEAVAGTTLRSAWPLLGDEAKEQVLTFIGTSLGRMHRQGCLHGDLKWDNIIHFVGESGPDFRLVDLDGGRLLSAPSRTLAEKDRQRFLQDLRRAEADPRWLNLLQESWNEGWRNAP